MSFLIQFLLYHIFLKNANSYTVKKELWQNDVRFVATPFNYSYDILHISISFEFLSKIIISVKFFRKRQSAAPNCPAPHFTQILRPHC